jgi:hypothetical protein
VQPVPAHNVARERLWFTYLPAWLYYGDMIDTRIPKRRWLQYSLQALLALMLLASIGMTWVAVTVQAAKRQREAVEAIEKLGGRLWYDYHYDSSGNLLATAQPPGPASWLRHLLGIDFFANVVSVQLGDANVTDATLRYLEALPQLREVDLAVPFGNTQVTDVGLVHLKRLTQLQDLNLSSSRVANLAE